MDPSSGDDRSLPMSMRWMPRNDPIDFMECAASPPSDGFFYASHSKSNPPTVINTITTTTSSSSSSSTSCEKGKVIMSESSGKASATTSRIMGGGGGILKMNQQELEHWAKSNITGIDSAPTSLESHHRHHLAPYERSSNSKGHDEMDGGQRSLLTPDVTPQSTPSHSPRIPKKKNPFFTGLGGGEGDDGKKDQGNWLFRSGPKTDNALYEQKLEIKPGTDTKPPTKQIRYAPKPSQLRDLNFFSPTSM